MRTSGARSACIRTVPIRKGRRGRGRYWSMSIIRKVIGIGEAGLDYHYREQHAGKPGERFSRAYRGGAGTSGLPLIVHTRSADDDTLAIMMDELSKKGRYEAVIHCYSSSPELGFEAVELGFYLGLGGILTFARSDELRETIQKIPLDRLLLETDSPYLTPAPFRKIKTNEPSLHPPYRGEARRGQTGRPRRGRTGHHRQFFSTVQQGQTARDGAR